MLEQPHNLRTTRSGMVMRGSPSPPNRGRPMRGHRGGIPRIQPIVWGGQDMQMMQQGGKLLANRTLTQSRYHFHFHRPTRTSAATASIPIADTKPASPSWSTWTRRSQQLKLRRQQQHAILNIFSLSYLLSI